MHSNEEHNRLPEDRHSVHPSEIAEFDETLMEKIHDHGRAAYETIFRFGDYVRTEPRMSSSNYQGAFTLSEDFTDAFDKHFVTPTIRANKYFPRSLPAGCTGILLLDGPKEVMFERQPSAIKRLFLCKPTVECREMMMNEIGGCLADTKEAAYRVFYAIPTDVWGPDSYGRSGNRFVFVLHLPKALALQTFEGLRQHPQKIRPLLKKFFPELLLSKKERPYHINDQRNDMPPPDKRIIAIPPSAIGAITTEKPPFQDRITDVRPEYIVDVPS